MNFFSLEDGQTFSYLKDFFHVTNQHACGESYAVTIKRFKKNKKGSVRKIWLRCDRRSKYISTKYDKRQFLTRQIECPFSLLTVRDAEFEIWTLNVDNPTHNYEPSLRGSHPVHRKTAMTKDVQKTVIAQTRINFNAKQILFALRIDGDEENFFIKLQNVYNIRSPNKIWRLARWAKDKSHKPKELPKMPTLHWQGVEAKTFEDKTEMLKKFLFYPEAVPDLTDIETASYPQEAVCPQEIMKSEIWAALLKQRPDKAPGPDGIPNRILKAIAAPVVNWVIPLAQASVKLSYHPKAFKEANTIILKKPDKIVGDYTVPKGYRPIILLNTIGKVLETVMAKRINYLAESLRLLPNCQFGARPYRSAESALEKLTEQIHAMWNQDTNKIATLLSLNVINAYLTVSHRRLIHDLRMKRIPT